MRFIVAFAVVGCVSASGLAQSLTWLGHARSPDSAVGPPIVSGDGRAVVAGESSLSGGTDPIHYYGLVRWTSETGLIELAYGTDTPVEVAGISFDGATCCGNGGALEGELLWRWSDTEHVRWPTGTEGDWAYPSRFSHAMAGDGHAIFGAGNTEVPGCIPDASIITAFNWNVATDYLARLGNLPCEDYGGHQPTTVAWAASFDGAVVAGEINGKPCRWTAHDGFQVIIDSPGVATGISGDGATIVGVIHHNDTEHDVFVWRESTGVQVLDYFSGPYDQRFRIAKVSGDGSTIIHVGSDGDTWVWSTTTGSIRFRDYTLTRCSDDMRGICFHPTDINFDGKVIVGTATTAEGTEEAFRLDLHNPPPEPPCPADFDRSGFVDTDDYDAFVHAFEEGDRIADFDGSCFVDTDDFDAFVLAFIGGC